MNRWLIHLLGESLKRRLPEAEVGLMRRLPPVVVVELVHDGSPSPRSARLPARSHRTSGPRPAAASRFYLTALLESPGGPFLFLSPVDLLSSLPRVEESTKLAGARVSGVREKEGVIVLDLERGGSPLAIEFHLRRSKGALVVLERGRIHVGTNKAAYPSTPGATPFHLSTREELERILGARKGLPPGLTPELVGAFGRGSARSTAKGLVDFCEAVGGGRREFWLFSAKSPANALPVPEPIQGGFLLGPFLDTEEAIGELGRSLTAESLSIALSRGTRPLKKHRRKLATLLARLQEDLRQAQRAREVRAEAEVLAAYQSSVPPGSSLVELPDPYREGEPRAIELDPALPLSRQIKAKFKLASKLEKAKPILEKRIEETQEKLAALDQRMGELQRCRDAREALVMIEALERQFGLAGRLREGGKKTEVRRLRRYVMGGGWFVVVGRNNKENDEITFHVAAPDDLWFHAAQVPGSHVVLKSEGGKGKPPRSVVEKAAALAAFFSRARASGLVPVTYTMRKYVRKPKRASPGTVVCTREKTLLVEPLDPKDLRAEKE